MALLTHGTGRLPTPTGLKHVAARGRAAQGEHQQQAEAGHREHHEQQDHQFHHSSPPLTEGCLSIENTASSPLRDSTSRINASISSDTMPAPAS